MTTGQSLFLHASSVEIEGKALLFLGHSTSGKSTIANQAGSFYKFIADDTVQICTDTKGRLRVRDGKNRNTPLVTPGTNHFEGIPLFGCYRLYKAFEFHIEPLSTIALARCLMDAVMEVDIQRKCGRIDPNDATTAQAAISEARVMRRKWFAQVAEMARNYPGWKLWFPRDIDPIALRQLILPS